MCRNVVVAQERSTLSVSSPLKPVVALLRQCIDIVAYANPPILETQTSVFRPVLPYRPGK